MCAHYTVFTEAQQAEIMEIIKEAERRVKENSGVEAHIDRDIYPRRFGPVLVPNGSAYEARGMIWGFLREQTAKNRERAKEGKKPLKPQVVSNTQIEHAHYPLWAEAFRDRRCLLPCYGFYESRERRDQFYFTAPRGQLMYIAGIYTTSELDENQSIQRYSMLTTKPNRTVGAIHDRMPLVLLPGEEKKWLEGDYRKLIDRSDVPLDVKEAA